MLPSRDQHPGQHRSSPIVAAPAYLACGAILKQRLCAVIMQPLHIDTTCDGQQMAVQAVLLSLHGVTSKGDRKEAPVAPTTLNHKTHGQQRL